MRNKRLIIIFSILLAITLVVLLGSIIFSVKTTNTRCLNYTYADAELDQQLLDNTGIPKGQNIFFVKEDKVIKNIEDNVPQVKVINIERKFPNRITIHYVKLFDYYQVSYGGCYYSLTHDGRITNKLDAAKPIDQTITIRYNGLKEQLSVGEYLYSDDRAQLLTQIVSSFERLDLAENKATSRFNFIDIETDKNNLYIGIMGSYNLIKIADAFDLSTLFEKIRLGYSTYISSSFDRTPNANGQYRMVYVTSPDTATNPYNTQYKI